VSLERSIYRFAGMSERNYRKTLLQDAALRDILVAEKPH
jgi:hypothetical protein